MGPHNNRETRPQARAILYAPVLTLGHRAAICWALRRVLEPFAPEAKYGAPPFESDVKRALIKLEEAPRYQEPAALTRNNAMDLQAAFEAGYRASGIPWNRSHFARALAEFNRQMREG